jgi:hypothetical protein
MFSANREHSMWKEFIIYNKIKNKDKKLMRIYSTIYFDGSIITFTSTSTTIIKERNGYICWRNQMLCMHEIIEEIMFLIPMMLSLASVNHPFIFFMPTSAIKHFCLVYILIFMVSNNIERRIML